MIIAGIIGVISFIGFAAAKSVWMFYVFAVPQGFCFAAMTMTPCQLLVSNWFGEKAKGRAISLFLTGMTLVYLLEFNILSRVVSSMGWRAGYIMLAICVAIAVVAAAVLVSWSPEKKGIKRIGEFDETELQNMQSAVLKGVDFKVAIGKPITWGTDIMYTCGNSIKFNNAARNSYYGNKRIYTGEGYSNYINAFNHNDIYRSCNRCYL